MVPLSTREKMPSQGFSRLKGKFECGKKENHFPLFGLLQVNTTSSCSLLVDVAFCEQYFEGLKDICTSYLGSWLEIWGSPEYGVTPDYTYMLSPDK